MVKSLCHALPLETQVYTILSCGQEHRTGMTSCAWARQAGWSDPLAGDTTVNVVIILFQLAWLVRCSTQHQGQPSASSSP